MMRPFDLSLLPLGLYGHGALNILEVFESGFKKTEREDSRLFCFAHLGAFKNI